MDTYNQNIKKLFDIASEINVDQNQIIESNKNLTADQIRDFLIKA